MTTPTKTQLQQSYQTSEHLYDQVFALVSTLQAWARPETQDQMSAETRQHIQTLIRLAWHDILRLARQFMDLPQDKLEGPGEPTPSGEIVMAGDIEVDGHIYQRAILVQFPTEEATRAAFQNSQNGRGFLITFPTFEKGKST